MVILHDSSVLTIPVYMSHNADIQPADPFLNGYSN